MNKLTDNRDLLSRKDSLKAELAVIESILMRCEHGYVTGTKDCPYCDRCDHGMGRYQHCAECNPPSDTWKQSPITDLELERFKQEVRSGTTLGIVRYPGRPRNYVCGLPLFPKLIAEYEQFRKERDKP